MTVTVGLIEAVTDAIGSADNDAGGISATRLTIIGGEGDTSISVETTLNWPEVGTFAIGGSVYAYTSKTLLTLNGVTYDSEGTTIVGLKKEYAAQTAVLDMSRTRSGIDQLRRAMLVEYAEGADLDVVGRNLNVLRPPSLATDARFREIIKAIAYNPRGTIYGLELALTGIVGAGNFEIYEDLILYPNKVFVTLLGAALSSTRSAGRAYLTGPTYLPAASDTTVELLAAALAIRGVRWKDENNYTDTRTERPSAQLLTEYDGQTPTAAWAYVGGAAEASSVTVLTSDGGNIAIDAVGATQAYYRRYARVQPESRAEFAAMMTIPAATTIGTDPRQFCLDIWDGARILRVGVSSTGASAGQFSVGFANNSGTLIAGAAVQLTMGTYYEIGIRKQGSNVYLLVDGAIKQTALASAFAADTSTPRFNFGVYTTASNAVVGRVRSVRIFATTSTDYWARRRALDGSFGSMDPTTFITGLTDSAPTFTADSVGKRISTSGVDSNSAGGLNKGRWIIETVANPNQITVIGDQRKNLTTNVAHPTRVTTAQHAFRFPDDLGRTVIITGSALGNDGTYVIETLRDAVSLMDIEDFSSRIPVLTNVAELQGASFQTETGLDWRMDPVFEDESSIDWELSDAGTIDGTTLTLPDPLPISESGYERVLEIFQTKVLSAQILEDTTVANSVIQTLPTVLYDRYPFYLADPLGLARTFLDELTVAGVIADYRIA